MNKSLFGDFKIGDVIKSEYFKTEGIILALKPPNIYQVGIGKPSPRAIIFPFYAPSNPAITGTPFEVNLSQYRKKEKNGK